MEGLAFSDKRDLSHRHANTLRPSTNTFCDWEKPCGKLVTFRNSSAGLENLGSGSKVISITKLIGDK